jgi:hypothetical protein
MLRLPDKLFIALSLVLIAMVALQLSVAVPALLGAFMCGSVYVFAGMLPSANEEFWRRMFTTVFLALVFASLVLIVPGTLGAFAHRRDVQEAVVIIAALLPATAVCYEIMRTPRVIQSILRLWQR